MPIENIDANDREIIIKLLSQIKLATSDKIYHNILSALILTGKSSRSLDIDAEALSKINDYLAKINAYLVNGNIFNSCAKEIIYEELHRSWTEFYESIPDLPGLPVMLSPTPAIPAIPAILVWGYDMKLRGKKSVNLNSRWDLFTTEDNLLALWEAIKISGAKSIDKGCYFFAAQPAAWKINCKGLANSNLTSFSFSGAENPTEITVDRWQLFWDSIKLSPIKYLDLSIIKIIDLPILNRLGEIMCREVALSNLTSLSLKNIGLYRLTSNQWRMLYDALARIPLHYLDLSDNSIDELLYYAPDNEGEGELTSFNLVCKVIQLPHLKHLKFRLSSIPE